MKLNDKMYTILKWVCLVALPALGTFYVALAGVWSFPFADEVAKTVNALCMFIGAIIGVSTAEYYKDEK